MMRFELGVSAPENVDESALWFLLRDGSLMLLDRADSPSIPDGRDLSSLGLKPDGQHYLGTVDGVQCWAGEVLSDAAIPDDLSVWGLRDLFKVLPEPLYVAAGRAVQIVHWDRTHRFCGRCGTPVETKRDEHAKHCPACGLLSFPRVSPAIIVAVTRGDRILLGRDRRHGSTGMFSIIAGFVEAGETLEEAVHREVMEETGIRVRDVRYFASQPWPFPHSLMIGFTAEYADGVIALNDSELVEAGWFRADELPRIPSNISISRSLIDWFVGLNSA